MATILASDVDEGPREVTRRVTNVGHRAMHFSSAVSGFVRHAVMVTPAALRLAPRASATVRLHVYGAGPVPLDQGRVTWLAADGTSARIAVIIARSGSPGTHRGPRNLSMSRSLRP